MFGSWRTTRAGTGIFALGLILTILLSAVSARAIDPMVERWRRRIKPP